MINKENIVEDDNFIIIGKILGTTEIEELK